MTKILVIDDEDILRGEVLEWLRLEDYETIGAADGMAGVEAAFKHLPHLIVCDITMPRLDGHGVLLEIRSNPSTADIPFIFVTARASYEDLRTGMDLGADDYITKPFTRMELLQAIQTRLDKKDIQEHHHQENLEQWQRAFELEREQRQLKSKLVAMFSHDFRNPLTIIMSSNSLLRDYADRLDENRRMTHMNRIDTAVRQLMQMLDDMLVVSQMETQSFEFKSEELYLNEFLKQIVDEFANINSDSYSLVFTSNFTGTITSDRRLMRQIAANLISNAIKYSSQGSEVGIILEHQESVIILKVQDHGIGIPEEDQANLFSAFQRASNVGDVRGTGLGLAIVKQAVDLHGGKVAIDSKINVGTTITVTIPKDHSEIEHS